MGGRTERKYCQKSRDFRNVFMLSVCDLPSFLCVQEFRHVCKYVSICVNVYINVYGRTWARESECKIGTGG